MHDILFSSSFDFGTYYWVKFSFCKKKHIWLSFTHGNIWPAKISNGPQKMLKGAKHGSSKFHQYIKKPGKINYWNQSSLGNVIHKDVKIFPILVKTPLIFQIS